jgi:predicted amidohydrolase
MIVATSQYRVKTLTRFEDFTRHVRWHVEQAARQGAELLLLPEYFTAELLTLNKNIGSNPDFSDLFEYYGKVYTLEIQESCKELSRDYNMIIAGGTHFTFDAKNNKFYNTCFVFTPDGQIFSQSKVHPSYELVYNKAMTSPAEDINIFNINGTNLGVSICYDCSFPEVSRILSALGADIILVPTCTLDVWGSERNVLFSKARAAENQVYVINSHLIGSIPFPPHLPYGLTFTGVSGIYSPIHPMLGRSDGIVKQGEPNVEMVVTAELDLNYLRELREKGHNQNRKDMRPDFYKKFEVNA